MDHLGRYDLVDELSRSYLGTRWAARAAGSGAEAPLVAIRCIELEQDPIARDRLSAAAFWAMEVKIGGSPAATDVVADPARLGVVSPFRAGETLETLVSRSIRQGIRAPGPVALRIVSDLLDDLEAVAQAAEDEPDAEQCVHGGITPGSVLVGQDGRAHLLDVGVGAAASSLAPWNRDPARLAYDVPERCGTSARVGAAADTFSLGVLAWELVAGRRLFRGETLDRVAEALRHLTVPALDEVAPATDPAVVALVRRALARDPSARMQSAVEFKRAIADAGVPPAPRTDVVAFVHGSSGRVSKALARLSTRPPPPAPPPPLGALDTPAPLGAAIGEEDAPTREMLRPEEETPTQEFDIPTDVLDTLTTHDEVTEPDAVSATIAASERARAEDAGAGSAPELPVPTAVLAAVAATATPDEPARSGATPVSDAEPHPTLPNAPAAPAAESASAAPTPGALAGTGPSARPSFALPLLALAALAILVIVAVLFSGSSTSEAPEGRTASAVPARASPPVPEPAAPPPAPAVQAPAPTTAPDAASAAPDAASEPHATPEPAPAQAVEGPAPAPAPPAVVPEQAPTPNGRPAPASAKRKPRPPKAKPFVPDGI